MIRSKLINKVAKMIIFQHGLSNNNLEYYKLELGTQTNYKIKEIYNEYKAYLFYRENF